MARVPSENRLFERSGSGSCRARAGTQTSPCALRVVLRCLTSGMRRRVFASCVAGLAVILSACSGSDRGPQAFCRRLQRDRDLVVTGVVDATTARAAVDRYHDLDRLAPEAIRTEWHQLFVLVQAAANLNPGVPTAQQDLVQQAYSAAPAAQAVTAYASQTCGVEIGKRRVGKECRSRWSPYH